MHFVFSYETQVIVIYIKTVNCSLFQKVLPNWHVRMSLLKIVHLKTNNTWAFFLFPNYRNEEKTEKVLQNEVGWH